MVRRLLRAGLDRLYGRNPADPSLYHLVVDTTVLSFDDCVDVVARAAEAFWAHAERSEPAREKMEA